MADREKVLSWLEGLTFDDWRMYHSDAEVQNIAKEAFELLKEHEAVEPIKMQRMDDNFSFFVPYFLCGNCRYELVGKDVMFCSHCGRAVKWE